MANDILKTLIAEAYGEGPEAMRLVAETILNRSAIRGLTPEQVVRQRAQYTGLKNPGSEAKKAWNSPEAIAAAEAAWQLAQQPGDPTGGADHYYAPGSISQPYWAKSMKPTVEAGGHKFFASRPIPPGELPEVASLQDTRRPTLPPVPVTPSIDMAQMRRISAPSRLIPDTFDSLSKPSRTLGDEIGMSPIQGGRQSAPMFDAAYDERTGTMRMTREPMDTQGMYVGRSREPAPVPAMQSPQLAGRRATDPQLQAALNARYPAQLPALPPPAPMRTASDRVRGNPMQTREQATTIASIPTRPQVSASDLARGRSGISTIASIPTTGFPTTDQIVGGTGFRPPPTIPDRLVADILPPALYGDGVAGVGTRGIAPVPFQRPTAVGTALSVRPVPPIPLPRPNFGMGGGELPPGARLKPINPTVNLTGRLTKPNPAEFVGRALMEHTPGGRLVGFLTGQKGNPRGGGGLLGNLLGGKAAPAPARTSLYYTNPRAFGNQATSLSGDNSVGSQADAAAARSSGEGGRTRRY